MTNKSKSIRVLTIAVSLAFILVASGELTKTFAQRDPFAKPAWARQREPGRVGSNGKGAASEHLGTPGIEQRIDFYKRVRQEAVINGTPVPKVTTVLTLDELAVTGIFKTPRGYAAMVEATPIKLSYTIYPGDKFFDGQLVAVEENRVVFRKVTKVGKGKFVSSVENKTLRQFTDREAIQGTAPARLQATNKDSNKKQENPSVAAEPAVPVVSPLTEMEKSGSASGSTPDNKAKKPVKVATRRHN